MKSLLCWDIHLKLARPVSLLAVLALLSGCSAQTPDTARRVEATLPEPRYTDSVFCLSVPMPQGPTQKLDVASGAFVHLVEHPSERPLFSIVNGAPAKPELGHALDSMNRGPLGKEVLSATMMRVDGREAMWLALNPDQQYKFVVIVISPDCGEQERALFISSTADDQAAFRRFVESIRFLK